MKKFLLILTLSLFSFAFSKNWDFSLSPYTGLSAGKLGEYLYSQYDKDFMVSDLQWNQVLWNLGLKADYSYKNFFATGDFTYYMPFLCGKMTDSDYNTNFKTNYVVFDNSCPFSVQATIDLGYKFDIESFSISPVLKGIFSYQQFNGKNGKGYLGDGSYIEAGIDVPWNDSRAEYHQFYDIDYTRCTVYSFIGPRMEYQTERFRIFTGFYISPFTFQEDLDYHHGTSENEYQSYSTSFSYFTRMYIDAGCSFVMTDKLSLIAECTLLFGGISKGQHYTNYGHPQSFGNLFGPNTPFYRSRQDKGMDVYLFDFKIGVKYSFGK